MEHPAWVPFLLQAADPLFPVGSYAHSTGLEEIVALGVVQDEASLLGYLQRETLPMLQNLDLPFLRELMELLRSPQGLDAFCALELDYHLMKLPRELREAGASQGQRRLKILGRLQSDARITALQQALADARFKGQHLAVFALHAEIAGIPVHAALHAWAYMSLSAAVAAAPKLIRIGEEGCQRVLCACIGELAGCVESSLGIPIEEAGWSSPLLDIASARHEHAMVRLFIS